jgi:TrmH family RNA methyltransferase
MVRISSADNPLVRRLRRLADSPRAGRETERSIAEGVHLVESALAARVSITAVVISEAASAPVRALAEATAERAAARVAELSRTLYDSIAPVEHGAGILIEIVIPRPQLPIGQGADAVYLDGIQDPGNAGTLLRTAAAAGIQHVVASTGTVFLWAPKVLRAAMGAHFAVSLYEDVPPEHLVAAFDAERIAADAGGGEPLYEASWGQRPTVWMFGSEGQGLSAAASGLAQRRVRIPIASAVESLNVGAAAAVCLFEQRRRREQGPR